jgi:predicted metalloprotease
VSWPAGPGSASGHCIITRRSACCHRSDAPPRDTEADVREAIDAAEAIGDDRIQEQATGTINKESWTHGSADQRAKWFNTGFKQGTIEGCDTFSVATP